MEPTPRQLEIYSTSDGTEPFEEWMEGLKDAAGRAAVRARLERVEDGNFGDHRSVGDGVSELRINFGPGYRVYYGLDGKVIVLLLCAGDKATQDKDIKRAKRFWQDYQKRG
jgi:putative addiction module killer protein